MRHSWIFAAIIGVAIVVPGCASPSANCNNGQCIADLSATGGTDDLGDLSARVDDLATNDLPRVYQPATIHDIDTGAFSTNTLVLISGAVITTEVRVRSTSGGMCTYQAWAQDPAGAAPSGIQLFTVQNKVGAGCAAVPPNGPFVGHPVAEVVDIRGRLFVQTFSGDGSSLVQHSVLIDSLSTVGSGGTVSATLLHDPAIFGGYGAGFQSYEGMVVTLSCGAATTGCAASSNKLAVLFQPNPYLWAVTGGALFGSELASNWPGMPGANGTAYTTITGVANTFLTGSLEPRTASDFVP